VALDLLSWAVLASYVVHLLDETMMNGGFVRWISTNFWPGYNDQMFFWFNAGAVALIAAGNIAFDVVGGHLIILPLIWIFGFALHGVTVHVYWTVRRRTCSPGLVTSILYWIVAYLFTRYGYVSGRISPLDFWTGAVAGCVVAGCVVAGCVVVGGFLTVGPTVLFPAIARARSSS
jgi:hypothetical protein